ncbi:MAG: hypothetical protein AAFX87_23195 [Bacteroidota bacterium]
MSDSSNVAGETHKRALTVRDIIYIIFLAYHISLVAVSIVMEIQMSDFGFLLKVQKLIPWAKYITLLGVLILFVDFLFVKISKRAHNKELETLKKTNNELKAKMFDLQEASRATSIPSQEGEADANT